MPQNSKISYSLYPQSFVEAFPYMAFAQNFNEIEFTTTTHSNYEHFGMAMEGRTFESMEYTFVFNGQVKDDEIYGPGNTYSALYWEYDARLGRRWNLDPKPQISISDYACFANNPIANVDVNGDKWADKETRKEARQLKKDMRNARTNLRLYRDAGMLSEKEYKARRDDLNQGLREVRAMGKDETYTFKAIPNSNPYGNFIYNDDANIYINFQSRISGSIASIELQGQRAHEFKHAYDIMLGLLNYQDLATYSKTSEVGPYKRQLSISAQVFNPKDYVTNLSIEFQTKVNGVENTIEISQLKDINISLIGEIFQNGYLYKKLPDTSTYNAIKTINYGILAK